jgi:predicted nucleic acid-binding protein
METVFLDTNVVIRYLTNDDRERARRARRLLRQAEQGTLTLVTSEAIIVEVVRILNLPTHYDLPRRQVAAIVTTLLGLPGLEVPVKGTYLRALELWVDTTVDFVDALSVAHMEHQAIATIASFDRDFDRFPQIARREP